jgi:DNA-binding transcriptional LysR family regulator
MNDYAGLASALLEGGGIGDLPPFVQPDLMRSGRLIEIMPKWRFRAFDLSMVHPENRHVSPPARVFKEFAAHMARTLFPSLPT